MLNLNRAEVLGNMTRDAEMRYTPNGQAVSNFTVATNRRWKNKEDEWQDATEYHDIVVWGKQAENVSPMLKKGQPVFVEGRLQTRNWEGQDGVKRYKTEIIAESVIVLSSRGASGGPSSGAAPSEDKNPVEEVAKSDEKDSTPTKNDEVEEIDIDDIPF